MIRATKLGMPLTAAAGRSVVAAAPFLMPTFGWAPSAPGASRRCRFVVNGSGVGAVSSAGTTTHIEMACRHSSIQPGATPNTYSRDASSFVTKPPVNTIVNVIPQGSLVVVERLGRYHRTLHPGLAVLIPWVDRMQYVFSSKEQGISIPHQSAITRDNVVVQIDGVLFLRIVDVQKAAYNIDNPIYNLMMLAQTTMRAEIGKLPLDKLFEEREVLNGHIIAAMKDDAAEWGIECKRYEIRDIGVSDLVRQSMDLQAEAERKKRKLLLESEGEGTADVNRAVGRTKSQNLTSDAAAYEMMKLGEGEAMIAVSKAKAVAEGIRIVSDAIQQSGRGNDAVATLLAAKYLEEFGKVAKESNTVVLGQNMSDASGMATQALSVFDAMSKALGKSSGGSAGSGGLARLTDSTLSSSTAASSQQK